MCSKNQAMAILGELYTACAGLFHNGIKDAYLYGSYARGDYTAESDIDILLTVTSDRTEIARMRHLIAEITSDLSLKHISNSVESGSENSSMLLHMLEEVLECAEEFNMAELIHLIVADNAYTEHFSESVDILLACAEECNACARESNL